MRCRWSCSRCGRTGTARLEAKVVFHQCRPKRTPLFGTAPLPRGDAFTLEELRTQLWADAFGRALGGDEQLLRRLER